MSCVNFLSSLLSCRLLSLCLLQSSAVFKPEKLVFVIDLIKMDSLSIFESQTWKKNRFLKADLRLLLHFRASFVRTRTKLRTCFSFRYYNVCNDMGVFVKDLRKCQVCILNVKQLLISSSTGSQIMLQISYDYYHHYVLKNFKSVVLAVIGALTAGVAAAQQSVFFQEKRPMTLEIP